MITVACGVVLAIVGFFGLALQARDFTAEARWLGGLCLVVVACFVLFGRLEGDDHINVGRGLTAAGAGALVWLMVRIVAYVRSSN